MTNYLVAGITPGAFSSSFEPWRLAGALTVPGKSAGGSCGTAMLDIASPLKRIARDKPREEK